MKDNIKYMLLGSVLTLCISGLFNSSIDAVADSGLQSTGRVVISNPSTGQEEVIFDYEDQNKLKSDINANSSNISDLDNKTDNLEYDLNEFKDNQSILNADLTLKVDNLEYDFNEFKEDQDITNNTLYSDVEGLGYRVDNLEDSIVTINENIVTNVETINNDIDDVEDSINVIYNDLSGFRIVTDDIGKIIGYYTERGADTLFPFTDTNIFSKQSDLHGVFSLNRGKSKSIAVEQKPRFVVVSRSAGAVNSQYYCRPVTMIWTEYGVDFWGYGGDGYSELHQETYEMIEVTDTNVIIYNIGTIDYGYVYVIYY